MAGAEPVVSVALVWMFCDTQILPTAMVLANSLSFHQIRNCWNDRFNSLCTVLFYTLNVYVISVHVHCMCQNDIHAENYILKQVRMTIFCTWRSHSRLRKRFCIVFTVICTNKIFLKRPTIMTIQNNKIITLNKIALVFQLMKGGSLEGALCQISQTCAVQCTYLMASHHNTPSVVVLEIVAQTRRADVSSVALNSDGYTCFMMYSSNSVDES